MKNIEKYKNENVILTNECQTFIDFTTKRLLVKIPENNLGIRIIEKNITF
jgi:hypothetical protein